MMESDERFKHLLSDPRFKTLRKKQKKVQIDDRFQSMFNDEKFTLKYSKDKRGRKQKKTSGDDLKRYYFLENRCEDIKVTEEEKCDALELGNRNDDVEKLMINNDDDEKDNEVEDTIDEDQDDREENDENKDEGEESELSSSSDESESDAEDVYESEVDDVDIDKIEYDWQPLDHDAETADTSSRRLAIQNLDWDYLDVKDIYTLINSIRPPLNVKIYVSEFGKNRLKQEEIEGPREIVEMSKIDEIDEEYNQLKEKMEALKNPGPNTYKINEYEDADEEMNPKDLEIRERIRKYQLNRMKYYYAVVEFDSVESAELVYKELNGMEYEGSSLELDLRFIPDDIDFDPEDIKSECDKIPDLESYKAPQFISSALQQTTVKFTWDETDIKRQEKLHRAYTKEELEKDDLDAYLASETGSEEEEEEDFNDAMSVVTANSEARVNKYKMLLQSLEEEAEKKKKVDVDVEWGDFSEDEEKVEEMGISGDDYAYENSDSESAPECRAKRQGKKHRKKNKERSEHGDHEDDDELDLLVMDVDARRNEFKFDPDDDRFKAVYESGLYNIDPSHPNFKRTQAFDMIAEKKREKRRKTST